MHVKFLEEAFRQSQGVFSENGAFLVKTGRHTGRAANSRFIVRRPETEETVNWGDANKAYDYEQSKRLFATVAARLEKDGTHLVRAICGCFPLEVRTTSPWHAAFALNMFRQSSVAAFADAVKNKPFIQILHLPFVQPSELGFEGPDDTLIVLDPHEMRVAILGTAYAGEIKKSAFSLCNYQLPSEDILSMHASANCAYDGSQSSVLFGLSGTGKTTLSADPNRYLIGDDEIIWSDTGLSNLEGGCYAKLINLKQEAEPDIFRACGQFGALLENVSYDPETRAVDFCDPRATENTRGSYPLNFLGKVFRQDKEAEMPKTIVFLSADAFGALPVVAKLDEWQTQYHFISGYTAKVAGTEMGVKQPKATFSACFGAPFMPRPAAVYAGLLAKKAKESGASVWLLNTGWAGGYDSGHRFPLAMTRHILSLIQSGEMDKMPLVKHPVFGFQIPQTLPSVESQYLRVPEGHSVKQLAENFIGNMKKFGAIVPDELAFRGGPQL